MLKYTVIFISVFTTLVSCNHSKDVHTYFGGKIINPKNNYVILYAMDNVIDTLFLDKNNRFLGKYNHVNEGLYYFEHGIENQYIYLEPNDSLMLRLNTWDFDESLVFAGKGAERNNILIDCFLENEKQNKMFYHFNKLEPNAFQKKIDSLLFLKKITYTDYITDHPEETSGFKNVFNVALNYPIYARVERYPIVHSKFSENKQFHQLEKSFYRHRTKVTINNDSLMYYPPYSRFLRNYLYNEAYSLGHKPMINEYSSEFTIDLLKTIDKKISSKKSKNAFLKQTVIGHFYRKSSCNVNKDAFDAYLDISTNQEDKDHITKLLSDSKSIHKNKLMTNFELYDFTNGKHKIHEVIKNKNTFLFFWNPEYITPAYVASRMNYFSREFPDVNFLQVRIDGNSKNRIHNLDIKNQFYLDAKSDANLFLTSKMPRSILINKEGIVKNGFASISSRKIYNQLKELSNN